MEIVEEDSSTINVQFLLDATTLDPRKILKRMSTIALGMYSDVLKSMESGDMTDLKTLANRDNEINRQYFLLVRLIRSTMIERRLASAFNLEDIDILDYRIAANLLEDSGDTVVELADLLYRTRIPKSDLKRILDTVRPLGEIQTRSINAFIKNNRKDAIKAIALDREYREDMASLKSSLEDKKRLPIDYLDLVYMFERLGRSWADIADLVKPIYSS